MKNKIVKLPPTVFETEFNRILNAKYDVVVAEPQRVPSLNHDLHDPKRNREAAKYLESRNYETIIELDSGKLQLFDTALIFITSNAEFPLGFLYTFTQVMFAGKPAVREDKLECFDSGKAVRIEELPLSAYCLFKVLIPRFNVVIGGDQHTPQGERWSKRQIKEAIDNGIYVYLRNENGELYNADTYDVVDMNANYLWGIEEKHRARLVVLSLNPL